MTPDEFVGALRAEGLTVNTTDWWNLDARENAYLDVHARGLWTPGGIINHHTGPYRRLAAILALLEHGRADLAGPLTQTAGDPDGVIHMIAWGAANHAGPGDQDVLYAVTRDLPSPSPDDTPDDRIGGGRWFLGNEWIHPGDSTPWPDVQYDAMVRFNAAVCRLEGWTARRAIFHKTWTRRKKDPAGLDLERFQADVAERLAIIIPPVPHIPRKGLDMPIIVRDERGLLLLSDLATWHKPITEDALRVLLATDGHMDQSEKSNELYAYAKSLPKVR